MGILNLVAAGPNTRPVLTEHSPLCPTSIKNAESSGKQIGPTSSPSKSAVTMSTVPSSWELDVLAAATSHTREVMLVSATLLLYDHVISLGEEIDHMWTTRWSLSQFLYLIVRALGLIAAVFLALYSFTNTTVTVLIALSLLILSVICQSLCQAIITLRVWYLFSDMPAVQYFATSVFVICAAASCSLSAVMWKDMEKQIPGSTLPNPSSKLAWIFAPGLVIHSTLLALQIYRFVRSSNPMQRESLLWRFLKEGIFMYALCTLSLLFAIIGLCQTKFSELSTYWAALAGSLPMATSIISVCRAVLSIRSLAATSHVDVRWLLNHAELSRVQWKPGANGEIFVEVNNGAIELPSRPTTYGTTSSLE
ncbi:hypothetical protein PAXRUDRAFT_822520 [Paxillus rubicundulus Ve08.2h10]|uniref:DUF6533 domain-containing protein n=1 Tax=Paxillus rubicundulus Ve08.2h10 TaxID=930991 RepID=A0A0D0ECN2_9AGAM|nr:hypothetical protein PAXRUDRAFT_822520 [Paxillus rubicundulus Ve08.2h10]